MSVALEALPAGLVWTGEHFARPAAPGLPTGFAALDAQLPGGGWPRGSIVELLLDTPGVGEIELLLPLFARAVAPSLNLWVAPPWLPYAPALVARGLELERLLVIRPETRAAMLWATRQALTSTACHCVLAWLERPDMAALRRLQLAAEGSGTPLFLFRPAQAARQPSPASLRLQLSGATTGLRVDILKRRGPAAAAPVLLPLERSQMKPGLLENRSERLECKAHGAQDARHINWIGEHPSTAQRSNPTAQ